MSRKIICIDAGHGGKDPGSLGPNGLREKDVALAVALRLGRMLSRTAGLEVRYTRTDDRFLELAERARIANQMGAALFLSIHCNSGPPGKGEGYEVFTTPGETASDAFATALFDAYRRSFPNRPPRTDMSDGDPDKEASFVVLRLTSMPAALFELEFIHVPAGEAFLRSETNQVLMAEALCDGVLAHLGLSEPPPAVPSAPAPVRTKKDRLLDLAAELIRLANES